MRSNKTSVGWAKKAAGAREEALSPKVGLLYPILFGGKTDLQQKTECFRCVDFWFFLVTHFTFKPVIVILAHILWWQVQAASSYPVVHKCWWSVQCF